MEIGFYWVTKYLNRRYGRVLFVTYISLFILVISIGILAVFDFEGDKIVALATIIGPVLAVILTFISTISAPDNDKKKVLRLLPLPYPKKVNKKFKPRLLVICHNSYIDHFRDFFSPFFRVEFLNAVGQINNEYDCIFGIGDNRHYTDEHCPTGYGIYDRRVDIENALKTYLSGGGSAVCTHDLHFFGEVGHFDKPYVTVEVNPFDYNHPICKKVGRVELPGEEGSYGSRIIKSHEDIPNSFIRGEPEVLFKFYHLTDEENLGHGTYDAAWLLKWDKDYWNLFYSYFNHNASNTTNRKLNIMWLNAIIYLISEKM
ncbi:MAG TPA: hypothetical protein VMX79_03615 [bacterium]|nr:hypothetical protein [bacterium]